MALNESSVGLLICVIKGFVPKFPRGEIVRIISMLAIQGTKLGKC